jgi:hypothetical protein
MRILLITILASIVLLAASMAAGAHPADFASNTPDFHGHAGDPGTSGVTTLMPSPMYVEIQMVLDQAGKTEQLLLTELAASAEDEDVQRIIRRIERLDVDKALAILKIQARYARLGGRWDLDYRLRIQIMELLDHQVYAVN